MEVRTHGAAGITHITNHLVAVQVLARMHNRQLHVTVACLDAVSVVNRYIVTEGRTQLGDFHHAIGRGVNRGPAFVCDIHTLVHLADFTRHRMDTGAESRSVAAVSRRNGRNKAPHVVLLVHELVQGTERRVIVRKLALDTLGGFAEHGHAFVDRGRLAEQKGIGAHRTTGTEFTGTLVLGRQSKACVKAVFVREERGRSVRQVVEGSLNLGHFLVELLAFVQLMVQDAVVNRGRNHLDDKQQYTDRNKDPKHGPCLEKEHRHVDGHRLRGVLEVYGCLIKIHGRKDSKKGLYGNVK